MTKHLDLDLLGATVTAVAGKFGDNFDFVKKNTLQSVEVEMWNVKIDFLSAAFHLGKNET